MKGWENGNISLGKGCATSYTASLLCTVSQLVPFMNESCWKKRFGTCGYQGNIVFVWVSCLISLLYHGVIYLHCFKLFPPDASSFIHMHNTDLNCIHRSTLASLYSLPVPLPCSLSALAVSLIYEVPLIWPKRLLSHPFIFCIPPSHPPYHQSHSIVYQRSVLHSMQYTDWTPWLI